MRKFAAHYLLTGSGLLLKNGIAIADNETFQFIDTKGELIEIEQMIFHSGLLMGAFEFSKQADFTGSDSAEHLLSLFDASLNKDHLSFKEVIDLARQLQDAFPGKNIPELLNKTEQVLLSSGFVKKDIASLYLLSALDLKALRFTEKTRLKKIV